MTAFLQKTASIGITALLLVQLAACGSKKTTTTTTTTPPKPNNVEETTDTDVAPTETRVLFHSADMKAAFARAKAEKKPIFLDFWAKWCGPCQVMDQSVFRDWDIADYMNMNVVNIKVDVDKKDDKLVSIEYGIKPLPSYVFVDPDGKVLAKHEGTITIAEFKKMMKTAFWKVRNPNG
jgi:thiol:disulfide interchange protein